MILDDFPYLAFSIISNDFNLVVENVKIILKEKIEGKKYVYESKQKNIYNIGNPVSGGAHFEKLLFFRNNFELTQTVFVSNYCDGFGTLMNILSKKHHCNINSFRISDSKNEYPYNGFSILEGKLIRIVYAMDDDGWVFYQKGELQWFEDVNYYQKRKISDRLNKSIMIEYLNKMNIDILDDKFWKPESDSFYMERVKW